MKLELLEIQNFRNIKKATISDTLGVNLLVGKNGSGKTSILEAIHFLGLARSFRTAHSSQLIQHGEQSFVLFSKISNHGLPVQIGIEKKSDSTILRVNGDNVRNNSQLAKNLPVQIINTNVHDLIEHGPGERRKFIEWGVFHVEHSYGELSARLRHILKQRNFGLKQHLSRREMKHWDTELVLVANEINDHRKQYFEELKPFILELLAKQNILPVLSFDYRQGWAMDEAYLSVLENNWQADLEKGYTRYGPHKANIIIKSGSHYAKDILSRGQQKLVACILRLAQINCLRQVSDEQVILLVDDLAAELDTELRALVLREAIASGAQVFVTATEEEMLNLENLGIDYRLFHVKHGDLKTVL